ncbi:MAG: hypothetical protein J6X34_10815, partial [Clostridia bacterium]|nr:hypothetical protein [Clostridia bacterium]
MEKIAGGKYNIAETLSENRAFRVIDMHARQYFLKRFEPGDESFDDEKRNLEAAICPYVPTLIETFEDESGRYIVTEWIGGMTVADHVYNDGPFDMKDTADIVIKICEALSFFHWRRQGAMVYLDLKPSNIILRDSGSGARPFDVCLVDLESARAVGTDMPCGEPDADRAGSGEKDEKQAKKTRRLGSPYYTAPEVLFGRICVQSDIYSIGALAGYMLTGREDYPSAYALKGFAGELVAGCTGPDPGLRFANVSAVIEAVRDYLKKEAGKDRKKKSAPVLLSLLKKGESAEKNKDETGINAAGNNSDAHKIISEAINFRRSCVMVESNPCFVSEMGFASAEMGLKTGVFSISERGRRNLDYYLTGQCFDVEKVAEKQIYPYVFDHKSMYLHGIGDWIEKGLLKASGEGRRLYTATFKKSLELPLRRGEDVRMFVDWSLSNFDLTLVSVERGDDDALVNTLMEFCSYVVATPDSNVEDMEAFRNYYMALARSGKIIYSKVRFVAWDYSNTEADREKLFKIVGKDKYLGEVFRSEARIRRKNRMEDVKPVPE